MWLQRVEGSDPASLDSLVESMTSDYSQLSPQVTSPDLVCNNFGELSSLSHSKDLVPHELCEGIVVAAPFPHDDSWYRARIVGVADSTLELLFLDFGDTASVEASLVKALRLQYYRLPVQAIQCRLAGVQPKGRSTTTTSTNTKVKGVCCHCCGCVSRWCVG